mgnify:CR=1 FL=1
MARISKSKVRSVPASAGLKKIRQLSHVLDNAIPVPGTKARIGLDPILGLLPGAGDTLTGLMSVYIVFQSARLGVPAATLGRMGINILFDLLAGTVPVLGDLIDVTWKANSRNVALLEKHVANPVPSRATDKAFVIALLIVLVALVLGIASFSVWLVTQAVGLLRSA